MHTGAGRRLHPHLGVDLPRPPLAPLRPRARPPAEPRAPVPAHAARAAVRARPPQRLAADPGRVARAPRGPAGRLAPALGAARAGARPALRRSSAARSATSRRRRSRSTTTSRDVFGVGSTVVAELRRPRSASAPATSAAARRRSGCRPTCPVVSFFGFIYPSKGFREFIEAAARLRERGVDASYLVVGGAVRGQEFFRTVVGRSLQLADLTRDYESEAKQLVHELGLDDVVRFIPFTQDTANLYQASDVVVAPSQGPGARPAGDRGRGERRPRRRVRLAHGRRRRRPRRDGRARRRLRRRRRSPTRSRSCCSDAGPPRARSAARRAHTPRRTSTRPATRGGSRPSTARILPSPRPDPDPLRPPPPAARRRAVEPRAADPPPRPALRAARVLPGGPRRRPLRRRRRDRPHGRRLDLRARLGLARTRACAGSCSAARSRRCRRTSASSTRLMREHRFPIVHLNDSPLLAAAWVAHSHGAKVVWHLRSALAGEGRDRRSRADRRVHGARSATPRSRSTATSPPASRSGSRSRSCTTACGRPRRLGAAARRRSGCPRTGSRSASPASSAARRAGRSSSPPPRSSIARGRAGALRDHGRRRPPAGVLQDAARPRARRSRTCSPTRSRRSRTSSRRRASRTTSRSCRSRRRPARSTARSTSSRSRTRASASAAPCSRRRRTASPSSPRARSGGAGVLLPGKTGLLLEDASPAAARGGAAAPDRRPRAPRAASARPPPSTRARSFDPARNARAVERVYDAAARPRDAEREPARTSRVAA